MSEKSTGRPGGKSRTVRSLDRRSYLKTVGATGGGLALGGLGLSETGVESARAAPSVLDDFEDGDISEYTGHTANYIAEQSSSLEGSYRLKCSDPYDALASTSTHGRGNRYKYRFVAGSGSGSKPGFLTCVQDGSNPINSCYWLIPDISNDTLELYLREGGSSTELDSVAVSGGLSEGTEYRGAVELRSDTVKAILYDASGNQLAATSEVSDTTHSSGYYGFYTGSGQPAYYDYVTKESLGSGGGGSPGGSESPNGPDVSGGGLVIDNFEDGNLKEYDIVHDDSDDVDELKMSESTVYHGSYAVKVEDYSYAYSSSGLENYPSRGSTVTCWMRGESGSFMRLYYGGHNPSNCHYVNTICGTDGSVSMATNVDGSWRQKDNGESSYTSKGASIPTNEWIKISVEWKRDGQHTARVEDTDGNQIVKLSYVDNTYKSGGVGWMLDCDAYGYDSFIDSILITDFDDSGAGVVVDDFEDGDLSQYDFDRGESGASVVSNPTFNGSKALEISGTNTEMIKTTGLPNEPAAGDVFSYWVRGTGGADLINLTYGVQDHTNRYFVRVNLADDRLKLYQYEAGTAYLLADQTSGFSLSEDVWYEVEVDWRKNGRHIVSLNTGSDRITIEETDTTWMKGGIGYDVYVGDTGTVYIDHVTMNKCRPTDAGKVVDDFDDGDLSEYTVVQGSASTTSSPTYFGSNALEISGADTELVSTSGLPRYPSAGDQFRARIRATGGASTVKLLYGVQDGNVDERYAITIDFVNDDVGLYYEDGSTTSTLVEDTTSCILTEDEWFRVEVDWRSDGTQTVCLNNDSEDCLVQFSGTDTSLTSGGIGFSAPLSSSGGTVHFDHVLADGLQNHIMKLHDSRGGLEDVNYEELQRNGYDYRARVTYGFGDGSTYEAVHNMAGSTSKVDCDDGTHWGIESAEGDNVRQRRIENINQLPSGGE